MNATLAAAIALGDRLLSGSYLDLALNFAPLQVTRIAHTSDLRSSGSAFARMM